MEVFACIVPHVITDAVRGRLIMYGGTTVVDVTLISAPVSTKN